MMGARERAQRALGESCVIEPSARTCELVCGPYEEERVARKSQAELQALKELRGQG